MLSAEEWIIQADRKASDLTENREDFMSSNQIIVLVCAIYFLTMVATGIFAARRNKKASDFLVAGRGLNTPMTAVTLAAVQIGVGNRLSGATNGYNDGVWPGIYYALGCGGGLIVAGLVTSRKLRAQEGYVPLDFFAQRYGDSRGVRFWAWLSNVPSLLEYLSRRCWHAAVSWRIWNCV